MSKSNTNNGKWENDQTKRQTKVLAWTFAWVVSMGIAAFGPRSIWDYNTGITLIAFFLNIAVGFGMIFALRRHLQGMDEMQQKIFRDAAVLTLGVGLVFASSYEIMEDIRLISFEPEVSHVLLLMCLTFMVGMIMGGRKYR